LWVHRDAFDIILDRITWLRMAKELEQFGVDTTIIGAYKYRPIKLDPEVKMIWAGQMKIGWKNIFITLRIWAYVVREIIINRQDYIILDVLTLFCAFPFDILSKLGLIHTKVVLDLRSFEFGGFSNNLSVRDRFWYLFTRIGLWYNRLFHYGISTITIALAMKVLEFQSNRNIVTWTSGYTLPKKIIDADDDLSKMLDELSNGHFLIIYHGVIHFNRGLDQAIKGVELANKQGANILFIIMGDGPGKQEINDLLIDNGGDSFCKIIPPVSYDRVFTIIAKAKLGIMTYPNLEYWTYNYPIKLAEYLSVGKPVLCTDIPMFRNAVQNCGCLFFVKKNTPELIADQLLKIISNPIELAKSSLIAKEEAKRLTWTKQAKILFSFLDRS
jgi:glycosyltransferase involved in cell wall biosynthesis